MEDNLQVLEIEKLEICQDCVSDSYLIDLIDTQGNQGDCLACGRSDTPIISLRVIAEIIETAMEGLYEVTASDPNFLQQMMLKDKDSTYEWDREGELTEFIANELAGFQDDKYGAYVQLILSEKHADWDMAQIGEPTPYDDEHFYQTKHIYPDGMYNEWRTFETIVHTESRYYSAQAKRFLDKIFKNISDLRTRADEPVVREIDPENENSIFYRGRHFFEDADVYEAMARPDKHIGPPPAHLAVANRMNAKGISVFYGATSKQIAMAEIRPPVKSKVVMGGFRPLRELRLLDLKALEDIPVYGSMLDPDYLSAAHSSHFFKSLVGKMTKPADPSNTDSEYLTTQVIADYLLNVPDLNLDGIIFPSSQTRAPGENVVLFHTSSRLTMWDQPEGSHFNGSFYEHYADDEFEYDPSVTLWLPHDHEARKAREEKKQKRLKAIFGGTIPIGHPSMAGRMYNAPQYAPSLVLRPDDVTLHQINVINIDFDEAEIKRQTYTESKPPDEDENEDDTFEDNPF